MLFGLKQSYKCFPAYFLNWHWIKTKTTKRSGKIEILIKKLVDFYLQWSDMGIEEILGHTIALIQFSTRA